MRRDERHERQRRGTDEVERDECKSSEGEDERGEKEIKTLGRL